MRYQVYIFSCMKLCNFVYEGTLSNLSFTAKTTFQFSITFVFLFSAGAGFFPRSSLVGSSKSNETEQKCVQPHHYNSSVHSC